MQSEVVEYPNEYHEVFNALEENYPFVCVTGNAGTGKSVLIREIVKKYSKNSGGVIVLAPTGVAANNVNGRTIHSFFGIPIKTLDKSVLDLVNQTIEKGDQLREKIQQTSVIIIDEVSMMRADIFDIVILILQSLEQQYSIPMPQIVLVGDIGQLPPVVTQEDKKVFDELYDTPYFFSSSFFLNFVKMGMVKHVKLKKVFRQQDKHFAGILNMLHRGKHLNEIFSFLNENCYLQMTEKDVVDYLMEHEYSIYLAPTNKKCNDINQVCLNQLEQKGKYIRNFDATQVGEYPNFGTIPKQLRLCRGASVIFIKNDLNGRWVNGTQGTVTDIADDCVAVYIPEYGDEVYVKKEKWVNETLTINLKTGKFEYMELGSVTQFPLNLSWAITIHKSQGLSFNNLIVDTSTFLLIRIHLFVFTVFGRKDLQIVHLLECDAICYLLTLM
jgi:ATP-dependent exoDNAse (exonuclease V) alpha subunit